MKELEKEFIGTGSVKGFNFKQVKSNGYVYLYEVSQDGVKPYYEFFERRESKGSIQTIGGVEVEFEEKVLYPNDNAFGVWAFTSMSLSTAESKFEELSKTVANRIAERLERSMEII